MIQSSIQRPFHRIVYFIGIIVILLMGCSKQYNTSMPPPNQDVNVKSIFPPEISRKRVAFKEITLEQVPMEEGWIGTYGDNVEILVIRATTEEQAHEIFSHYETLIPSDSVETIYKGNNYWLEYHQGVQHGMLWTNQSYVFRITSPSKTYMLEAIEKFPFIEMLPD